MCVLFVGAVYCRRMSQRRGFTILELLIVLAVFGLLATIAVYAIGVSRATTRDAKRVSDISVLRSALSQYWLQKAGYPANEGVELGKPGQNADGLTTDGFVGPQGTGSVILPRAPIGPSANEFYRYKGNAGGYSLRFTTERATAFGKPGTYFAHASGIDGEDTEK